MSEPKSNGSESNNFIRIKNVSEINSSNDTVNEEVEENTLNKSKRKVPDWLFESTSSGSKKQNDKCSKKQKILNESSTSNDNNNLNEVNSSNSTNQKDETAELASNSTTTTTNTASNSKNEGESIVSEQAQEQDVQESTTSQEEQINSTENVIVKKEIKQEEPSSSSNDVGTNIVGGTSTLTSTSSLTVVKQEASSTTRDSCKFGIRCYRRNPIHRNEMAHPGDNDYKRPNFPSPPKGTPDCRFGDNCYRRNPIHFRNYSHPPSTDFEKNRKERAKRKRIQRKKEDGVIYDYHDSEDEEDDNPFLTDSDDDYIPSESEDENSEKF